VSVAGSYSSAVFWAPLPRRVSPPATSTFPFASSVAVEYVRDTLIAAPVVHPGVAIPAAGPFAEAVGASRAATINPLTIPTLIRIGRPYGRRAREK
jgi:hypothetical protein